MLALSVVGGPHHVFPVPGGPVLGLAFFQSLRVAADNGCDVGQTSCAWVREQIATADLLLEWRSIEELAWVVPGSSTALGVFFTTIEAVRTALVAAEPQACADNDDDNGGSMADTGPILTWSGLDAPTARPPPGANEAATGPTLSYAYQRAYLAAARATYASDGDAVNLRPWLVAQTAWDLEYVDRRWTIFRPLVNSNIGYREPFQRLDAARNMLLRWQASALSIEQGGLNQAGPWSRATVERLLLQRFELRDVVPDGADESGGGGGGGNGLLWGVGAVVLAALAGSR